MFLNGNIQNASNSGVSHIGNYAFARCISIVNLVLPNTLNKTDDEIGIGVYAFAFNNSLTNITFNNKDFCISITLHKIAGIKNLIDSGYGYSLTLCGLYNDDKRYEFSNSYLYNVDIDKECKDVVSKMVANIVNRTIMEFFFRVYHYVE